MRSYRYHAKYCRDHPIESIQPKHQEIAFCYYCNRKLRTNTQLSLKENGCYVFFCSRKCKKRFLGVKN